MSTIKLDTSMCLRENFLKIVGVLLNKNSTAYNIKKNSRKPPLKSPALKKINGGLSVILC